ncbi:MAG: hypothetical protein ACRD1P_09075 [Thermoanaerobaculia bacterium]
MPYVLFHDQFPEIAKRETRTISVLAPSPSYPPPGEYALLEMYCDELRCDCRRVFFYVVSSRRNAVEAVIAYGWEPPEFYAKWMHDDDPEVVHQLKGPILNLTSPQSANAPRILHLIEELVLPDRAYIERLTTHYGMFKRNIDNASESNDQRADGDV